MRRAPSIGGVDIKFVYDILKSSVAIGRKILSAIVTLSRTGQSLLVRGGVLPPSLDVCCYFPCESFAERIFRPNSTDSPFTIAPCPRMPIDIPSGVLALYDE